MIAHRMTIHREVRGVSVTQFLLLLLLVGILISVAVDRIWSLREEAERVGVIHLVASMRSALAAKMSEIVIKEGAEGWVALAGSNPMALLDDKKSNAFSESRLPWSYEGEGGSKPYNEIMLKHWYFDRDRGELIYRVLFTENFETTLHGTKRIVLKIVLDYHDVNNNGLYDKRERVRSIRLTSYGTNSWVEK